MDEIIDNPANLHYKNGKVFGHNMVFMGYVFLPLALFVLLMGSFILAPIILAVALFLAFTSHGIVIDTEERKIKEYTSYLGFIKIYKSYSDTNFKYLTIIPSKHTTSLNMRMVNSINHTEYLQGICLLNQNYRNKRELTCFPKKTMALDAAKKLSFIMEMEYFEYNPKVIRKKKTKPLIFKL